MLPLCSRNCCSLQLALKATVFILLGLSTCSTNKCGLQMTGKLKYSSVTIRNIGIKLCQVRCDENCFSSNFVYINETLNCPSDDLKKIDKTSGLSLPKDHPNVPAKPCSSKVCNSTPRCPETGSGKADCEQARPTFGQRYLQADHDLQIAIWKGDVGAVKRILAAGLADVNSRDRSGWTPVMWAAHGEHREVLELLVRKGADASMVDRGGNNILHLACWGGDVEMVRFVLSLNVVDIDARNNDRETAADRARSGRHQRMADLLMSCGA